MTVCRHGDRSWGLLGPSDAEPFTSMPLSLSVISCSRHSLTIRSMHADQQDEDEERGDRG
jgi:hypothetical protein